MAGYSNVTKVAFSILLIDRNDHPIGWRLDEINRQIPRPD